MRSQLPRSSNLLQWPTPTRWRQLGLMLGVSLWAGSVLGGIVWQDRYAAAPGTPAVAPMRWPGGPTLPFHADRFNLLIFLHPQCPCSAATIRELARITARAGSRLDVRALVVQYPGQDSPAVASPLFRQAAAVPGVVAQVDPAGELARRFQAACSGQTLLYDPAGRLIFSGGITFARGHDGDNDGEFAVLRLINGPVHAAVNAAASATPVYGCPLFADAPTASPAASPQAFSALTTKEPTCRR